MTNWKRCWSWSIILFVAGVTFGEIQSRGPCNRTQYIELGKTGIIQCSFDSGMYSVYWYDSDDVNQSPFFYYENSKKSGQGHTLGEFDVEPDGSLVIKNVTFEHDHVFTVACLVDEDQPAVSASITVVVVVKPSQPYPLIRQCYGENTCHKSRSDAPKLNCFVADSKPAVRLQWFRRTMHSDQKLSSEKSIHNLSNFVFSSYANLTTARLSDTHFIVAVCKAQSVPPMFAISESVVLLEGKLEYSSLKKEEIFIEESKQMKLDCLTGKDFIYVWKRRQKFTDSSLFGLVSDTIAFRPSEYDVNREKALILNTTSIHHEGMYACFQSDGESTTGVLYNVTIYVKPVPNYPVVEGCGPFNPCVMTYRYLQGELTCKLLRVRPMISLKWGTFDESLSEKIKFFDEKVMVLSNNQAYNVIVTTRFSLQDKSLSKIAVLCSAYGKFADVLNITTRQVDLKFSSETSDVKADFIALPLSWLVIFVTMVPILIALGFSGLLLKGKIYKLFKRNAGNITSQVYEVLSQDNEDETSKELEIDSTSFTDENFSKLRNHVFGRNDLNEIDATALLHISKTSDHSARASLRFLYSLVTGDTSTSRVFRGTDLATTTINLKKDDEVLSFVKGATDSTMISQQSDCNISWPDVLFTIYHSCKPTFREEVVSKMSSYNMAVPFLLPSPLSPIKVSLLFTDLQNVKKELVEKQSFTNVTVTEHPFPTVAAVRIGEIGFSKSNILNLIIGSLQNKEDAPMFPASNEDDVSSSWSRGTVEAGWFLPTEPTETHNYSLPMATCFLNLRGRMGTERTKLQEKFLFLFSSCILIFVQKSSYEQQHESLINEVSGRTHVILVVFPDDFNKGQPLPTILRKGECLTVIIFQRCSELKIAREISKQIVFALKENETIKTLEKEGRQICKDLDIKVQ